MSNEPNLLFFFAPTQNICYTRRGGALRLHLRPRCPWSSCHAMPSLSPASFLSPQPPLDLSSLRDMQLGASNQPRPVSKSMLPSNAADIVGCRQEHRSPSRPKFAALVAFCNPWYETRESGSGTNTENKTQQQNQPFRSFFPFRSSQASRQQ